MSGTPSERRTNPRSDPDAFLRRFQPHTDVKMWETRDLRRDVGSWCLLRQSQEGAVVDVIIKTMTVEDIERRRAEIKKIIHSKNSTR